SGCIVAGHSVGTGARGSGRGTQIRARRSETIGVQGRSWTKQQLIKRIRPGDDVTANKIWVFSGKISSGARTTGDNPVADPRGKPFDLTHNLFGNVVRVAGWNVSICIHRMNGIPATRGVGHRLLAH